MIRFLILLVLSFSLHAQVTCRNTRLSEWVIRGILTKNEEIQKALADMVTMCGEPKVLKIIDRESLQKKIIIMEHLSEQLKRHAQDCSSTLKGQVEVAKKYQLNISSWEHAENTQCWSAYVQIAYYIETLKALQYAIDLQTNKK